ncbi:MAG: competence/damage-inducible protein A, partial [Alphaproteobacteria bacterium]
EKEVTACLIVIGNEILSGRTKDKNLAYLAERLNEWGIRLREARVIPDIEDTIVATINECRPAFDYVFTTGGIGPTHDDITAQSVAKAFDLPLIRNPEAVAILEARTRPAGFELNEARLRMANTPEGATLIENPVSGAPGFQIGNVYVMAGVPSIMRAMLDGLRHRLVGGKPMLSLTVRAYLPEGELAGGLGEIQGRFPELDIGSYPFYVKGKYGASLVMRGTGQARLESAAEELRAFIRGLGAEPVEDDAV